MVDDILMRQPPVTFSKPVDAKRIARRNLNQWNGEARWSRAPAAGWPPKRREPTEGPRVLKPTTPMRLATPTAPLSLCCSGRRPGGRGPDLGIWDIGGVARTW